MTPEKRKALSLLFASFPVPSETKTDLDKQGQLYELALEGISARFVEQSVKAFIQGRVPTHNPSFRPKPTELAAHARPLMAAHLDCQKRMEARKLQLEHSGRDEPTPEEKAAVQKRLQEFRRNIAQAISMDPVANSRIGKPRFPNADETKAVLEKYYGGKP